MVNVREKKPDKKIAFKLMKKTVDEKCTQQIFALRAKNESNEK